MFNSRSPGVASVYFRTDTHQNHEHRQDLEKPSHWTLDTPALFSLKGSLSILSKSTNTELIKSKNIKFVNNQLSKQNQGGNLYNIIIKLMKSSKITIGNKTSLHTEWRVAPLELKHKHDNIKDRATLG